MRLQLGSKCVRMCIQHNFKNKVGEKNQTDAKARYKPKESKFRGKEGVTRVGRPGIKKKERCQSFPLLIC